MLYHITEVLFYWAGMKFFFSSLPRFFLLCIIFSFLYSVASYMVRCMAFLYFLGVIAEKKKG